MTDDDDIGSEPETDDDPIVETVEEPDDDFEQELTAPDDTVSDPDTTDEGDAGVERVEGQDEDYGD